VILSLSKCASVGSETLDTSLFFFLGGNVTFDIGNDAPTLTSAKVTFRITLRFPSNQTALPDGRVVWSQNCIINGTRMRKGDPVFPDQEDDASDYVFPDGQPFSPSDRRPGKFVFVWQTWEGIESVEIVQVMPLTPAIADNAVDLTVTCQGSLPEEVCTTISDPDCVIVQESVCNPVQPSPDCQFVLRQAFNQSGLYCVNISLADANTLAVASTQVSVQSKAHYSMVTLSLLQETFLLFLFMLSAVLLQSLLLIG
uniref:Premelanosome protein n=1 Tax=Pseudonaja textilis TaxID=8673 RepID=A0A670YJE9_PSETE